MSLGGLTIILGGPAEFVWPRLVRRRQRGASGGSSAADGPAYQALRLEGFALHPLQFRAAPEDESGLSLQAVGEPLAKTFVVGGFHDDDLVGVGGLTRFDGANCGTAPYSGACTCASEPGATAWRTS